MPKAIKSVNILQFLTEQFSCNSDNSVDDVSSDDFLYQLRDGMRCRLLSESPKRHVWLLLKLAQFLPVIITNPYNLQAWIDLMLFHNCCLKVPGSRSGHAHHIALADIFNEGVRAYPGRSTATTGLHCTNRVAAEHNSYNKRTEQEPVSEMLEDGDVMVSVLLAAGDETLTPYSHSTLVSKRPALYTRHNIQQTMKLSRCTNMNQM
jgi:hypothetical protein